MNQPDSLEPPSTGPRVGVVILAAGQGTRMRSRLPKVLHPVAGLPMVRQVVETARTLNPSAIALVVGHGAEQVSAAAGEGIVSVIQAEQLGTGHAVLQARDALRDDADLIVELYADVCLIEPETLQRMIERARRATIVVLTGVVDDPTGYGRITRDSAGRVTGIVETRDLARGVVATDEINSGVMAFQAEWLWENVGRLPRQPNGEFFLTDLVAAAVEQGRLVETAPAADPCEIWGVNTQAQLADVNRVALDRIRRRLLDAGVRMLDPGSVFVDSTVEVEPGAVIHPNTHLQGRTRIATGTEVGPNSIVRDTVVGRDCRVVASVLEEAWVGERVTIGPFAHLRPGARIEDDVELGNYAEVKGSTIGAGSRMHHFGYIGDAALGTNVNVGAGTITCNYDGEHKHRTVVGDDVFIGSDTMLVAPVTLGDGSRTGAGSVVRRNVQSGDLVVGVPARPVPGREPDPRYRDHPMPADPLAEPKPVKDP